MDLKNLAVFLKENSLPAFRLAQIKTAVYKNFASGFERITVLHEALRARLKYDFRFSSLAEDKKRVSKNGDAVKFSFLLKDGLKIETVLLNLMAEKWSLCVSTQAGCPVRCPFCATGRTGLFTATRNFHAPASESGLGGTTAEGPPQADATVSSICPGCPAGPVPPPNPVGRERNMSGWTTHRQDFQGVGVATSALNLPAKALVTGPTAPLPMTRPSSLTTPTISAAVPVRKTSSAV